MGLLTRLKSFFAKKPITPITWEMTEEAYAMFPFHLLMTNEPPFGSSTLNRGHEHQRLIRRCNAREGRPRCFGGTQRDSGT